MNCRAALRTLLSAALPPLLGASLALAAPKAPKGAKPIGPPLHGVKTPGVPIPFGSLKSEAELAAGAGPVTGVLASGESVLVATGAALLRFDGKTNQPAASPNEAIAGVTQSCGGLLEAFSGVWAATCGDPPRLARFLRKPGATAEPPAWMALDATPPGAARAALAASADSLWLLADAKTSLQRIDPAERRVVSETRLPAGCSAFLFAESSLWVACPSVPKLFRIDPRTGQVEKRIEVGAEPVALAAGESSIWVLCRKEGKVARVDPKTNKASATIELGIPGADGTLAFGDGAVWASAPGFPVMRIAPATDKLVQQFHGDGAGGTIHFGAGSVWVTTAGGRTVARFDPRRIAATLAE